MEIKRVFSFVALLSLGCSETATQVGDAAAETAVPDTAAPDTAPSPDAPGVDTPAADAPRVDSAPMDVAADTARDTAAPDAPAGCGDGSALCAEGAGMRCVDVRTDPNHCGRCGVRCCTGMPCVDGRCQGIFGCSPGSTRCDCACVNTQTDSSNCGACGNSCPAGRVCHSGICSDPGCVGGGAACAAGLCVCAGRCTSLQTDTANCGACGNVCPPRMVCTAGRCEALPTPDGGAGDAGDAGGGLSCGAVTEPAMPMGVCDGRGRIACQMWADALLDGGMARVVCVQEPAGCARADTCADLRDLTTCRCGAGPACGPGQSCQDTPAGPACRCLRPR
ncbi:MAG: hypothetical protein HY909_06665 [Deltaproteobacteria bacterium]|nr:hypothetical protein [Deltaproteobacteria bacterium]